MTRYIIVLLIFHLHLSTNVKSQSEPDDIAGLELWLKSSDNVVIAGSTVSSWGDVSSNGLLLSQGSVTQQGTYDGDNTSINGYGSISLDGVNDFYTLSESLDNVRTVFLIYKHETGSSSIFEPVLGHSASYDFHGNSGDVLFRPQSISTGITNGVCRISQVQVPAAEIHKPSNFSLLSITSVSDLHFNQLSKDRTQNRFWNGAFVEIIMYSQELTESEVEEIENYLRNRYAPPLDLGPDIVTADFCSFELSVPERFVSVEWSDGSTASDLTVTEPGIYWADVVDVFGFVSRDSIEVNYPGNVLDDFILCIGSDSIWDPNLGGSSIEWQDGSSDATFNISEGGDYFFTATDGNSCTYTSATVTVLEDEFSNTIEILEPVPFCLGNSLDIIGESNEFVSVLWSTNETSQSIVPASGGEYSVDVINGNGCLAQDTVVISSSGSAPNTNFDYNLDCQAFGASFEDLSSTSDGSTIVSWGWEYDGIAFGENASQSSIENLVGAHQIGLSISTDVGCTGFNLEAVVFPGVPEISLTSDSVCPGIEYELGLDIDYPFDVVSSQFWSIYNLDGSLNSTSNTLSITTTFGEPGNYLVEAEVTGQSGCVRTAVTYLKVKSENACFDPSSNMNLRLWLKSDENVVTSSGQVSEWADPRSNGVAAVSPSPNRSPVFVDAVPELNWHPALRFDGTDDYMTFDEVSDMRTVFLLFKHASGYQSIQAPILGHSSFYDFHGNTVDSLLFSPSNTSSHIRNGVARMNSREVNPIELLKPKEYSILSLNPTDILRAEYLTNDRNSAGRFWNGDYVEILAYNDSLSIVEIAEVEQYLRYKYAPPIDLPREVNIPYGFCDTSLVGYQPWFTSYAWSTGSTDSIIQTQKSGMYHLTVTDIFGYESTDSVKVIFNGAFREDDTPLCEGNTLVYDTELNPSDYTFEWSTMENSSSIEILVESDVHVQVFDTLGCVFYSDTILVYIDSFPSAVQIFEPSIFCLGNELYLDGGFDEAEAYVWNTNEESAFIEPQTNGEYWVEATNANGCVGRDTVEIVLAGVAPTVEMEIGVACATREVEFVDTTVPEEGEVIEWQWTFPDANGQGETTSFAFAVSGDYPVELSVLLDNGCTGVKRDTVHVKPLPLVGFNYDEVIPCAGNEVGFESQSGVPGDGIIAGYNWEFSNGTVDDGIVGSTVFETLGNETVLHIVTTTDGCIDSLEVPVIVLGSPVAAFSFDTVCVGGATNFQEFVDVSESGPVFYQWQFGDGFFSNFPNTSHAYASAGAYEVTLTATGNDFGNAGCMDTETRTVRVFAAPNAAVSLEAGCLDVGAVLVDGTEVTAIDGEIDPVALRTWEVVVGPNLTEVVGNDSVTLFQPSEAGVYNILYGFETEAGCVGTTNGTVEVLAIPTSGFVLDVPNDAPPVSAEAENISTDATVYHWWMDDAVVSNAEHPLLFFPDTGDYVVSLVAENGLGCSDSSAQAFSLIVPEYDLAILDIISTPISTPLDGQTRLELTALLTNDGNTPISVFDLEVQLGQSINYIETVEAVIQPGELVYYDLGSDFEYAPGRILPYTCMRVSNPNGVGEGELDLENNHLCVGLDKEGVTFIKPFPNPVGEVLHLEFVLPRDGDMEIVFVDAAGREVLDLTYALEEGYAQVEVDVSGFAEGVYLVRYGFDGEEEVERVVVGR